MDTLVVTSKIKANIKKKAQMNTSAEIIEPLTKHIDILLNKAIEAAKSDGRKTVMARDIEGALNDFADKGQ